MPTTAMSARPLARPSSPSIRLKALTAPVIQKTVSTQSSHRGSSGQRSRNPRSAQNQARKAMTSCPKSFSFGDRENLSSASPSKEMATDKAIILKDVASGTPNITGRPVASRKPPYERTSPRTIARPPPRGIGTVLMRRGSGLSTMPNLRFSSRTIGVRISVATSDPKKTDRYGRSLAIT